MKSNHLLEIKDLKTHFKTAKGKVTAVNGISFHIDRGEILGVVGESGCGKSVTSQSIMRLLDEKSVEYEGDVKFKDENVLNLTLSDMQRIRGNEMSMIFQDPLSSLNPVYTIGHQIAEAIILHQKLPKKEAYKKAEEMLKLTGIPDPKRRINEYPHELSGGMRQRVMIAMALSCEPELLIADEPTTALDVTIQAQIMDMIVELKDKLNMGIILITHDLGVVADVCTRVAVMYLGQIVEEAGINELFSTPKHPYTRGLLKSIPQIANDKNEKLHVIQGTVPSLDKIPKGCRFSTRCPFATDICRETPPTLKQLSNNQKLRCWHVEKIAAEEESNFVKAGK